MVTGQAEQHSILLERWNYCCRDSLSLILPIQAQSFKVRVTMLEHNGEKIDIASIIMAFRSMGMPTCRTLQGHSISSIYYLFSHRRSYVPLPRPLLYLLIIARQRFRVTVMLLLWTSRQGGNPCHNTLRSLR